MATPSLEHVRLVRKLESTSELSADDIGAIGALPIRVKAVTEKRDIVREGVRPTECCLLLEGIACRYKMLSNGRRQIMSFHFPGDIPDLHSLNLPVMDHSLSSVTSTRVAFMSHDSVKAMMRARPVVADALGRDDADADVFERGRSDERLFVAAGCFADEVWGAVGPGDGPDQLSDPLRVVFKTADDAVAIDYELGFRDIDANVDE